MKKDQPDPADIALGQIDGGPRAPVTHADVDYWIGRTKEAELELTKAGFKHDLMYAKLADAMLATKAELEKAKEAIASECLLAERNGDPERRCVICQDLKILTAKENNMIQDLHAHWQRLTKIMDELFVQARSLHQNWDRITPPENKDAIECYSGPVLDVLDLVNHLHIELVWLAGHIEGSNRMPLDLSMASELAEALKLVAGRFNVVFQPMRQNEGVECIKVRPEERPNARGDTIIEITPGTAPVSEIAKTLSTTVEKVNGANRRLGLKPAGWVTWKLHDGTIPEPAGTYNLAQWKLLRDDLWPRNHNPCQPFPPDRLVNDEGDE